MNDLFTIDASTLQDKRGADRFAAVRRFAARVVDDPYKDVEKWKHHERCKQVAKSSKH